MRTDLPNRRRSGRRQGKTGAAKSARSGLPIGVAVLALALTAAIWAVASWGSGATSAGPGRVASAAAGAPRTTSAAVPTNANNVDTYTASITNGSGQNDLYSWLAARSGQVVRVNVTVSKPLSVSLTTNPLSISMSSDCSGLQPPANCEANLNLAGTRYLIFGGTGGVLSKVTAGYKVDGYFAVDPVTQDQRGFYTVPLRVVSFGSSGEGEGTK